MYLPKFKTTKPLYTYGDEFYSTVTGTAYEGAYFITSKGKYYSGTTFNKQTSQELIRFSEEGTQFSNRPPLREKYDSIANTSNSDLRLKEALPLVPYIYTPNYNIDINRRFFAKSKITQSILEIDVDTYRKLYNKDVTYHYPSYDITFIDWNLSSPVDDTRNGSYIIEGSRTKNKKQVAKLDRTFPGIYDYLTQTGQL